MAANAGNGRGAPGVALRLQPPRGNRRPLAALLDERHLGEVERDVQAVEPAAQRLPRETHDHVIGGDQNGAPSAPRLNPSSAMRPENS